MRRFLFAVSLLLISLLSSTAQDEKSVLAIRDGSVIDGTGKGSMDHATILIVGSHITKIGNRDDVDIPSSAAVVDARGKYVIPGLIDAHVHFSQTGWVDGRPDVIDLRNRYPYAQVIEHQKNHPEKYFLAYLWSGVTGVFDVGGYPWTWGLRERGEHDPMVPRIAASGPLLSTIDFWLNLPFEQQFIYMKDSATVRGAVKAMLAFHTDAIKIWYIMPPQPPDTSRIQKLVRLVVQEASTRSVPVIVHATGLWEAKDAIRAGASTLVHSVFDKHVDDEFLTLAKEHHVIYTPTMTVLEGYREVRQRHFEPERYPPECIDGETWRKALATDSIPAGTGGRSVSADSIFRARMETASWNVKRVQDAGITVAMGTDAGNPLTLHGPSVFDEMERYQAAGLSPIQVLTAATLNGARAMGREKDIGTIEVGKFADVVILNANPLEDIRNLRKISMVIKDGKVVDTKQLLQKQK
jgi:imidazolonepropionase-like amidohydrolase